MNKKQKVLTIVAVAIFAAIVIGPTLLGTPRWEPRPSFAISLKHTCNNQGIRRGEPSLSKIDEEYEVPVSVPLFVLAVFYTGLFFILGPTATKNRPPNL